MSNPRILVAPTQVLMNKFQAAFKTRREYPQGYFKEDAPDNVDMSQLHIANVADVDGNGDILMETINEPFLAPNGEACYYANQDPVLVSREQVVIATGGSNKKVVNYDKLKRMYDQATGNGSGFSIVAEIETGIWVGLITDTDNHARIVKRDRIRK